MKCYASTFYKFYLERRGHENRTTHEDKDHESGDPLLPNAQELRLCSRSGGARLQLQAVDVRDGEDGGGDKPRQAHHGTDAQHDRHNQQVQMIAASFLWDAQGKRDSKMYSTNNKVSTQAKMSLVDLTATRSVINFNIYFSIKHIVEREKGRGSREERTCFSHY